MNANEQVLRKMNQENPRYEVWEIDAVGNCGGIFFPNVVTILQPRSTNPGIAINGKAFGMRGTLKAIALVNEERVKLGLTPVQ